MLTPTKSLLPGVSARASPGAYSSGVDPAASAAISLTRVAGAPASSRIGVAEGAPAGEAGADGERDACAGWATWLPMPAGRGDGAASTFFTECYNSTEPSRRPIPSMSFSFASAERKNEEIKISESERNESKYQ